MGKRERIVDATRRGTMRTIAVVVRGQEPGGEHAAATSEVADDK